MRKSDHLSVGADESRSPISLSAKRIPASPRIRCFLHRIWRLAIAAYHSVSLRSSPSEEADSPLRVREVAADALDRTTHHALLTLAGFCLFSLLAIAPTDQELLVGSGVVRLAFADVDVPFGLMLIVGPTIILVLTAYLHVNLAYGRRITLPPLSERLPLLINQDSAVSRSITVILALCLPIGTSTVYAWKAAPVMASLLVVPIWTTSALLVGCMAYLRSGHAFSRIVIVLSTVCALLIGGEQSIARLLLLARDQDLRYGGWSAAAGTWSNRVLPVSRERSLVFAHRLEATGPDAQRDHVTDLLSGCVLVRPLYLVGANDLSNVSFVFRDLRAARFREANLQGSNLESADLSGADLQMAHMEGANLLHAHLATALLRWAHLEDANIKRAYLKGASFVGANLEGANLQDAVLDHAYLFQVFAPNTDFTRARMVHAELFGANLTGANLHRVDFTGANLQFVQFSAADLQEARLANSNLYGASLEGANLRGADLADVVGLECEELRVARNWCEAEGDLVKACMSEL